jgi:predicted nucleotidyltransferase
VTAQKALQQFVGRVEKVNKDPYFLGKVTKVVLFGSILKPEIERLSDVDLAVELAPKEEDFDRARARNYQRVEELAAQGHRFRNFLDQEGCWYWEVSGFLKGQSRVIALADYAVEKTPARHRLHCDPHRLTYEKSVRNPQHERSTRRLLSRVNRDGVKSAGVFSHVRGYVLLSSPAPGGAGLNNL